VCHRSVLGGSGTGRGLSGRGLSGDGKVSFAFGNAFGQHSLGGEATESSANVPIAQATPLTSTPASADLSAVIGVLNAAAAEEAADGDTLAGHAMAACAPEYEGAEATTELEDEVEEEAARPEDEAEICLWLA
jgi:hypothetical protein